MMKYTEKATFHFALILFPFGRTPIASFEDYEGKISSLVRV
jgi:hypothetical protein